MYGFCYNLINGIEFQLSIIPGKNAVAFLKSGIITLKAFFRQNFRFGIHTAPSGWNVYTEYKTLDALLYLIVGKMILLYERCKVGVKRTERLGSSPLVLHDTQEVDHLVAEGGKMFSPDRRKFSL